MVLLQFAIYPLELVRTRLAVCPQGTYTGMRDCFGKIVSQEGYRAFYRGLLPSLVSKMLVKAVDSSLLITSC